jgi:hypothetical protein
VTKTAVIHKPVLWTLLRNMLKWLLINGYDMNKREVEILI